MPLYDYGRIVKFNRDADGLLTEKATDNHSVITSLATFTQDSNGSLVSSTHPLGTDTYQRNGRKQVTRQTWYDLKSAYFTYDIAGRLSSLNYPDGSLAVYTYDSRDRITNIAWKGQTLQTQYDGVGNILQETRSNGITTSVTSDKNSMPIRINHYTSVNTLFDLQCSRNVIGSVTSCNKTGTVGDWSPVLTAENTSTQYKYDRSFTIDKLRGQTAATDVSGNQTAIPGPRAFSGTFDFQNLLTDWNTSNSSNAAVYDGQNRLIQWTRGSIIRKFHYDDKNRLLFETDAGNTVTAMWLYRGKQVVAMADSNGVYFYHNDLSANVTFLSNSSGNIAAAYRYLPFGLQTESMSTVRNPFTFVGSYGVLDLGEGLYYMRRRTYDAKTHAFLSNDPSGTGVTANAREYAGNNPVNWIDPGGLVFMRAGWQVKDRDNTPQGNSSLFPKGCRILPDAFDALLSSAGKYGDFFARMKLAKHIAEDDYGKVVEDLAGIAVGAASSSLGVMLNFMIIPNNGNRPSPYSDFTSPEFTLPEFTIDN